MTTALQKTLADARIILTCGTGGVGKTTTSVLLGLAAAQMGRRVLVLTVDPARRLANALGLAAFDQAMHPIWRAAGPNARGSLDGMMLDAKRTFDRVVERYAPDPETAAKILRNPLYEQLSTMIAGSQEYMAMEQLYEITQSANHELIILDTPPSHQALDFFQAPLRMVNALSGSMLKLFVKPTLLAGRLGAALFAKGGNTLMRMFGRLTGVEMLQEISDLILSAVNLFGGFEERARAVQAMLRQSDCGIILVTLPHTELIDDAERFIAETTTLQMQVRAIIMNRTVPDFPALPPYTAIPERLRAPLAPLFRVAEHCAQRATAESALQQRLARQDGTTFSVYRVPEQQGTLTDLPELLTIATMLREQI